MKLAVGICSHGNPPPDFSLVLLNLIANISGGEKLFDGIEIKHKKQVSLLPQGRQDILDECLKEGFTHLLFLDDDMVFPATLLRRLMKHKKRCIGVNSLRKDPKQLIYTAKFEGGEYVKSKDRKGIDEVAHVGLAMFLLDLDAVRKIPRPHFEIVWNAEIGSYRGEDHYFLNKLRAAGEKIFVDHELSNECGHIGQFVYSYRIYG